MQNINLREFLVSDEADLIELFFEFGKYLAKLDEDHLGLVIVPANYGQKFYGKMQEDVKNKRGQIFVLESAGKVVGFIAGIILEVGYNDDELDCKPHIMGRVIELFISEKFRGMGFGTKLINKLKEYFRENQCYKINIEVFAPNISAFGFYKSQGFSERNIDLVQVI